MASPLGELELHRTLELDAASPRRFMIGMTPSCNNLVEWNKHILSPLHRGRRVHFRQRKLVPLVFFHRGTVCMCV